MQDTDTLSVRVVRGVFQGETAGKEVSGVFQMGTADKGIVRGFLSRSHKPELVCMSDG